MARPNLPVPTSILTIDHATVTALQNMSDYQPLSTEYSVPQLLLHQTELAQAEQAELALEQALEQARMLRAEKSHVYHNAVKRARSHVVVQYGPDSAAVALVGMTRKSERKRPSKRQPKA
ncbi:MAG: hypothetical protein WCG26_13415 [Chloroflexales bacterium]